MSNAEHLLPEPALIIITIIMNYTHVYIRVKKSLHFTRLQQINCPWMWEIKVLGLIFSCNLFEIKIYQTKWKSSIRKLTDQKFLFICCFENEERERKKTVWNHNANKKYVCISDTVLFLTYKTHEQYFFYGIFFVLLLLVWMVGARKWHIYLFKFGHCMLVDQ